MAKEFNATNFDAEVIKSAIPAVVDFWAPWCMPCKAMLPVIEDLSKEEAGVLNIGKLNVEEFPDLAGRYGIMSIPAVLIFKNGNVVGQVLGSMPKTELKNKITAALENV